MCWIIFNFLCNVRKQEFALVADAFGVYVLEGGGIFEHAVRVHARLVREGVHADVGLLRGNGGVRRLRDRRGAPVDVFELLFGDALIAAL